MKICDAHVHLGKSGPWQPYGDPTIYVGQLIPLLDRFNISRAVVFPNPNVGDEYHKTNNYIAQCIKKYPKRLVGFGRVDPRRGPDAIKELKRIKEELRLSGVKLHPIVECFRPDHPFFDKFFENVVELRLPVLIHTGDGFSAPGLALKVAKRHPDIVMILAHLREGCVGAMKDSRNIYVETSGTLPDLVEMAVRLDENRILFGSDIPYFRVPTQTAIIEAAKISDAARRKIYFENFEHLFANE